MSSRARIACFTAGELPPPSLNSNVELSRKRFPMSSSFCFSIRRSRAFAGPGVLPTFSYKEYGPYRTWFSKDSKGVLRLDGRGGDEKGEGGVERVVRLIEKGREGGEWVGCMGFSQGTRVVGGLLLEQMRLREISVPGFPNSNIRLRFGVLCNGGAQPMLAEQSYPSNMDLIDIPTLHLHGLTDKNLGNGRKLFENHFDPKTTILIEINYHHAMPWYREDLLKFSGA